MAIPVLSEFVVQSDSPIDSRLVLTKSQMISVDDNLMPQVYPCWCKDDGKYYIYNKSNVLDANTGRFRVQPDNIDIESINSAVVAQRSYTEAISDIYSKLSDIQQTLKAEKEEYVLDGLQFSNGIWKRDFLPDHEKLYFCQGVNITYKGTYSQTTSDNIKVNDQTISLGKTHLTEVEETTVIKVLFDHNILYVYCDDTLIGTVEDTIILTIEIDAVNIADATSNIELSYEYSFVDYQNIEVKSKNGYPITEKYEGEIEYWDRMCQAQPYALEQYPHALASHHSLAVYSIGDYSGVGSLLFRATFYRDTLIVPETNVIRYIYMANWDMSGITGYGQMFTVNNSTDVANVHDNDWMYYAFCKKLDFTNVVFGKLDTGKNLCRLIERYYGDSVGSLRKFGDVWRDYNGLLSANNQRTELSKMIFVRTLGDISEWDMSKTSYFSEQFSEDYRLEFIGDIGKWNITSNCVSIKNMLRSTFKLKGISSSIMNWDVQNVTAMNGTFGSTLCIGDNAIYGLGRWNTGKVANFRYIFSYFDPWMESVDEANLLTANFSDELLTIYRNMNQIRTNDQLTKAERDALELQNIGLISDLIVDKKTNLSFIADWDVSSCGRFDGMVSYNPYLTDLGDLRKWEIDPLNADLVNYGFFNFIQYCTGLETLYMPSIPRGTNVVDIARGCSSLANIIVDELNVEAIDFSYSPLTKQSVLNLINAATDDVSITLSSTTYSNVENDQDVLDAIDAKSVESITVTIGTNS